jgi:hypothetical protein
VREKVARDTAPRACAAYGNYAALRWRTTSGLYSWALCVWWLTTSRGLARWTVLALASITIAVAIAVAAIVVSVAAIV